MGIRTGVLGFVAAFMIVALSATLYIAAGRTATAVTAGLADAAGPVAAASLY